MSTRTAVATTEAAHTIAGAIADKLDGSIPAITAACAASGQPGSTTIKVTLKPDKELPGTWHVEISERLSLSSTPIDATARIEHDGPEPQLSMYASFEEAA